MAFEAVALKYLAFAAVIFMVKRPSLTNSSSLCYWQTSNEAIDLKETYIYSSIWQLQAEKKLVVSKKYLLRILLLLAGDIEICPGPRNPICATCSSGIKKSQSSSVGSSCKMKFHLKCLKEQLVENSEELYCRTCFVEPGSDTESDHDSECAPELINNFCKKGDSRSFIKTLTVYSIKLIKSGFSLLVPVEMFMSTAFPKRTQPQIYVTRNLKLVDTIWCVKIERMGNMVAFFALSVLILNIKEEGTWRSQDWRPYGSKFLL